MLQRCLGDELFAADREKRLETLVTTNRKDKCF